MHLSIPQSSLFRLLLATTTWCLYPCMFCAGHLGASLGVVELTVALHYVFNTPDDKASPESMNGFCSTPSGALCTRRIASSRGR